MFPCLDIFVLGSLPHFYLADASILGTLDGMEPKKHLHETGIYFDLVCFHVLFHEADLWKCKEIPGILIFYRSTGACHLACHWACDWYPRYRKVIFDKIREPKNFCLRRRKNFFRKKLEIGTHRQVFSTS